MFTLDLSWDAAVERYILSRDLADHYAYNLRLLCDRFGAFARNGKPFAVPGLNDSVVNQWLESLKGQYGAKRVSDHRAAVVAVWNDEYERGHIATRPGFIRRIRVPQPPVTCWTIEELRKLLGACGSLTGHVHGQANSRALWWSTFCRLSYDTGLRRGDVLSIPWNILDVEKGVLQITQGKTKNGISQWLSKATRQCLRQVDRSQPVVLYWPHHHTKFDYWFRKLVRTAGIRCGTTRWIRRSGASYVERDHPGRAAQFLGHRTAGLAEKHYLDRSITTTNPIRPPDL